MQYCLTKKAFTADRAVIEKQGDELWEYICDTMPLDQPFTVADLARGYVKQRNISERTARDYFRAVLTNVLLQDTQGNPPAVRRKGNSYIL